jgi:hypothetical protein
MDEKTEPSHLSAAGASLDASASDRHCGPTAVSMVITWSRAYPRNPQPGHMGVTIFPN